MRRFVPFLAALLLILSACGSDEPPAHRNSGIDGIAVIGPQCPVEREGTPCPDQPYPNATIRITNRATGEVVVTVKTDGDGTFLVALDPGDYVLEGLPDGGRPFPIAKPLDVTVPTGQFVEVTVSFDSGIR